MNTNEPRMGTGAGATARNIAEWAQYHRQKTAAELSEALLLLAAEMTGASQEARSRHALLVAAADRLEHPELTDDLRHEAHAQLASHMTPFAARARIGLLTAAELAEAEPCPGAGHGWVPGRDGGASCPECGAGYFTLGLDRVPGTRPHYMVARGEPRWYGKVPEHQRKAQA
jgi:hypothetical protein